MTMNCFCSSNIFLITSKSANSSGLFIGKHRFEILQYFPVTVLMLFCFLSIYIQFTVTRRMGLLQCCLPPMKTWRSTLLLEERSAKPQALSILAIEGQSFCLSQMLKLPPQVPLNDKWQKRQTQLLGRWKFFVSKWINKQHLHYPTLKLCSVDKALERRQPAFLLKHFIIFKTKR